MELVLYYIQESRWLLISFLILMFFMGILGYSIIRNFRQDKKIKIFFYGLFLRMKDIDILKISIVLLKTFLACYAIITIQEFSMWVCFIMLVILTAINVIITRKRIIYQVICTAMQIVMIYFVYVMDNYLAEIEYSIVILTIKTCLVVFVLMLIAYIFLRDIDLISEDRVNKEFKKGSAKKSGTKKRKKAEQKKNKEIWEQRQSN